MSRRCSELSGKIAHCKNTYFLENGVQMSRFPICNTAFFALPAFLLIGCAAAPTTMRRAIFNDGDKGDLEIDLTFKAGRVVGGQFVLIGRDQDWVVQRNQFQMMNIDCIANSNVLRFSLTIPDQGGNRYRLVATGGFQKPLLLSICRMASLDDPPDKETEFAVVDTE